MGKQHNRILRIPQGIGAPPGMGAPPMPPGAPPGMDADMAAHFPPGTTVKEMPEADGLKFHNLKLEEQILGEQLKKLEADEQVLKVNKENLELRRQIILGKTRDFYKAAGIEAQDQVSMRNGKYYKIRLMQSAKPGEPKPKPPDLRVVRDENGKESMVPKEKETPPEAPPETPPETPGPAPAEK